jgi:hypothetical protein
MSDPLPVGHERVLSWQKWNILSVTRDSREANVIEFYATSFSE